MRKPWAGGEAFADDPLTIKDHFSYYWFRFRVRFFKKYRDEEARFEDMIRSLF